MLSWAWRCTTLCEEKLHSMKKMKTMESIHTDTHTHTHIHTHTHTHRERERERGRERERESRQCVPVILNFYCSLITIIDQINIDVHFICVSIAIMNFILF